MTAYGINVHENGITGPYWVNVTADGEHQVCGRHGSIIRYYPAAMAAAAEADCRKLQRRYSKAEQQARHAAVDLLASVRELVAASCGGGLDATVRRKSAVARAVALLDRIDAA